MSMQKNSLLIALLLSLSGCATIMGDKTQTIPITSTPSEASISVRDEAGEEVFKGATPTTVTLNKSTGSYFGKKSYTVTIAKDGFVTQVIPLTASINGWYIGNIIFGGLIGWLAVDPFNGGMYTLSPDAVKMTLATDQGKTTSHNNTGNGSISIVLLQDVPEELRSKLVKIN